MTERKSTPAVAGGPEGPVVSYKGFDCDLRCDDHQYEIGGTYTWESSGGENSLAGFTACEAPMDALTGHPPDASRFAIVEQSGRIDRDDFYFPKILSSSIAIQAEVAIGDFIETFAPWIIDAAREQAEEQQPGSKRKSAFTVGLRHHAVALDESRHAAATGDRSHAAALGHKGHAAAKDGHAVTTGTYGHAATAADKSNAAAAGECSHAVALGDGSSAAAMGGSGHAATKGACGHAVAAGFGGHALSFGEDSHAAAMGHKGRATALGRHGNAVATEELSWAEAKGDGSHAAAMGQDSHAQVAGRNAIAVALSYGSTARAAEGGAIMLAAYDEAGNLIAVRASLVGRNGVEPGKTYRLTAAGEFEEVFT